MYIYRHLEIRAVDYENFESYHRAVCDTIKNYVVNNVECDIDVFADYTVLTIREQAAQREISVVRFEDLR